MEDLQRKCKTTVTGSTALLSFPVQQQQKPSQLRCRRKKSGSTTITAAADEADTAMSSEFQSGETR